MAGVDRRIVSPPARSDPEGGATHVTATGLTLEYTGANLLFVVGCPRSGTTWVQRLLATHPGIRTGQESDVFDQYIGPQLRTWQHELDPQASGRGGVGLGCYFQDGEFRRLL